MNRLAIIGSGDLGQLIAHHAQADSKMIISGYFDDYLPKGKTIKNSPILGKTSDIERLFKQGVFDKIIVGIGYQHFAFRKAIFQRFKNKIPFANILHSSCYIDASCQLGEGIFMLPNCTLDAHVCLEDNVLLNTACTIAHDSTVGRHSFLSPRVAMAGFVRLGSACNIGINTTIIDNICLADNVQTGGGTVVTKDLNKAGLYVGVPARFVR